jgi:hypothetical protein
MTEPYLFPTMTCWGFSCRFCISIIVFVLGFGSVVPSFSFVLVLTFLTDQRVHFSPPGLCRGQTKMLLDLGVH